MGSFNRDRRPFENRGFGRRDFGARSNDRQMFDAVCSNCGKDCQVPFRPTGDKPVYCSDCFEKMGGRNERGSSDRSRFDDRKPREDQNKAQFEALNTKLDKIIDLLEPKNIETVMPNPVVKKVKEAKTPKAKKESTTTLSTKKK